MHRVLHVIARARVFIVLLTAGALTSYMATNAGGRAPPDPAAAALATRLDECDGRAGITVGGPGEILKCADSESAFALLDSFVVLYEYVSGAQWQWD